MKKKYLRPEYEADSQLVDIMTPSVQYNEDEQSIDVNLDIEDLFG